MSKSRAKSFSLRLSKVEKMEIAARIIKAREALGLNKAEFSRQLGCGKDIQYNIESLRASPQLDYLKKLQVKLDINPNYILSGINEMFLNGNTE